MTKASNATHRAAAETVFDHTMAPQAPLYAVIDAARSPEGPHVARDMGAQCVSLFAGKMGEELGGVAPHLIQFRAKSPIRNWWFEHRRNGLGILTETPAGVCTPGRTFRPPRWTRIQCVATTS